MSPAIPGARKPGTFLFSLRAAISADDVRHVPPSSDADVVRVADRVRLSVARLMERRGLRRASRSRRGSAKPRRAAACRTVQRLVFGTHPRQPRARRCVARVGAAVDVDDAALPPGRCCAASLGHDVHAGVCVPARDRMRLERLARYAGRPPPASERSSLLPDGRLLYWLKHRWRDATTHVIYEPLELMAPRSAMVPPLLHSHQAGTSEANRRRRGCSNGAHKSRNENRRPVPVRAAPPTNFESHKGVTRKDLRPQSTSKRNNLLDKNFRSGLERASVFKCRRSPGGHGRGYEPAHRLLGRRGAERRVQHCKLEEGYHAHQVSF